MEMETTGWPRSKVMKTTEGTVIIYKYHLSVLLRPFASQGPSLPLVLHLCSGVILASVVKSFAPLLIAQDAIGQQHLGTSALTCGLYLHQLLALSLEQTGLKPGLGTYVLDQVSTQPGVPSHFWPTDGLADDISTRSLHATCL